MTERHKDFTSKRKSKNLDPVTFTLEGEEFLCAKSVPGALLLDFIADADSGDGGRAATALITFITDVVTDDDKDRFSALIRDPKKDIDIEVLAEICEWLVEQYAARPTEAPKSSSTTRSRSGRGSTARSVDED